MGTLRWGILATGGIAHLQTSDLRTAGLTVQAVGSRSLANAERFAGEFKIPERHGSYEELCRNPNVDIVYVATPHPMHCENALLAIENGKHVLVEKAFALNAGEAERMVEAARHKGVFIMEAMWTRFLPSMRRVMEIIQEGGIGTPRVLIADHNQYIPMEKARRVQDPTLGGGALLDLGIYVLSFASRIFGTPKTVTSRGTLTDLGVDELISMILEYDSGAQASLHTGSLTPGPNVASVVGDKGRIDLDGVWYTHTTFSHYDQDGGLVERYTSPIEGRGMQYQAKEVESCINAGKLESEIMSPSETLQIMKTMDEIRRQIGVVYPGEKG